jgi:catechol 2,3-dioxygenase-like lactoylglutathione lyase family enzyme
MKTKIEGQSTAEAADAAGSSIDAINAVTLATRDMLRSVRFYAALGFRIRHGGESARFTSFDAGISHLNLIADEAGGAVRGWGRVIFYVGDVDRFYRQALGQGLRPDFPPRDAAWGERYFHLTDPDGHELSFAKHLG